MRAGSSPAGDLDREGNLGDARRQFQESLDTRIKLGAAGLVAESRASLASLSIEEGHASEAVTVLQEVLPEFEKEKDVANRIAAGVDLSRALLVLGRTEATKVLSQVPR